jgi:protoheme IX farnesyltransferase
VIDSAAEAAPSRLADFYELTKPRMNFLVLITTLVGLYMAASEIVRWPLLVHTMLGTTLCAAGAAVMNQFMERRFDALMRRTRNRPLAAGRIAPRDAAALGVVLSVVGVTYLTLLVNPLTAILGAVTILSYLLIYTPLKRVTSLNTIIGAVPGAIPPVMGWTAVHDQLTLEAWALFGILFLWQMPHFLAIAIMYKDDYAAGGYKMLPVVDPQLHLTSFMIVLYTVALIPVSLLPTVLHISGPWYAVAALVLGAIFLAAGVGCAISRKRPDARRLFFASIIYLPLLLAFMMIDKH